jgi:ferredoxin
MMTNVAAKRLPGNAAGKYFTTEECDGCAYCAAVAPALFDFDKLTNTYFVARQPRTDAERDVVLEAMEDCPLDAIREGALEA